MGILLVAVFCLVFAFSFPHYASALTSSDRATLISQLLAQVTILQQKITALGGTSIAIPANLVTSNSSEQAAITRTLALGSRGNDVASLQLFLITQNLLPSDSATGYFGPLTRAAVIAFQRRNNLEQVGHVGRLTRGIVNVSIARSIHDIPARPAPIPAPVIPRSGGYENGTPPSPNLPPAPIPLSNLSVCVIGSSTYNNCVLQ